ncbi:MAG: alpha-amylase family glycosyl hydrolase [Candidatus Cyclobacteriaceae bacterium M3_2C_046]
MKINHLWMILVLLGLMACNQAVDQSAQDEEIAAEFPNAVTYEIFVQSFYDSNGDGIGDINGMTSKLDYLEELGVKGIWLMPIMPSPTYHKYDVTDYRDIHPDYGTLEDFKHFLSEAHNRDIKVVIDFVINHTSNHHPWFQSAIQDKNSPYRDFYVWEHKDDVAHLDTVETGPDSDNPHHWHPVEGDDEMYYGFFWGGMPDLNFNNPKVKEEIFDAGRFWLEEVGVDGFRLDAARHIFDEKAEDNHKFWVEFKQAMEQVKPDVYLVGEVWSDVKSVAPYLKGIPALFNFDMGLKILEAVKTGNEAELPKFHKYIQNYYDSVNADFIDAIFITNHDQNRVMNELNGDINKAKIASSILLTLPGSPYLYYGEEIGMKGEKPDEQIREPFIWDYDQTDPGQTSWLEPVYSTAETLDPLVEQIKDPNSLYHHYENLIHKRNHSEILTYGHIEPTGIKKQGLSSYYRIYEQDTMLVVHNLTENVIALEHDLFNHFNQAYIQTKGAELHLDHTNLVIPSYTTIVLENDKSKKLAAKVK